MNPLPRAFASAESGFQMELAPFARGTLRFPWKSEVTARRGFRRAVGWMTEIARSRGVRRPNRRSRAQRDFRPQLRSTAVNDQAVAQIVRRDRHADFVTGQ